MRQRQRPTCAPTTPTAAASMVAARSEFRTRSEVRPRVIEVRSLRVASSPTSESRKYSSSVLSVAARPSDASTIHATVRASVSTTNARRRAARFPGRCARGPAAIKAGCRVRNKSISPAVTGRVARNSRRAKGSTAIAARPKLHRQAISASPSQGRRNMV